MKKVYTAHKLIGLNGETVFQCDKCLSIFHRLHDIGKQIQTHCFICGSKLDFTVVPDWEK